jgi:hypothetical protein
VDEGGLDTPRPLQPVGYGADADHEADGEEDAG